MERGRLIMEVVSLKELLKAKGLEVAEDTAKLVVEAVFEFAEAAAKASKNTTDDVLVGGLLPLIKPMVLKFVDEIDKKVG